ncbi:vta1 like domain-containing [Trichoderma cornu-damae]|uniref:Vta1 like domain-containing n=1 Tax=Trichoderma cornu-damae TaxID=654480 RepID=A0A9P8TX62_9HYPO|nr:vta1 like domain-containing [Trichoderma cornu-damae]
MAPTGYTDDRDGHLEAGLLRSTQGEKQTGYRDFTQQAPDRRSHAKNSSKMVYFRRALLVIAVGSVLGLGVVTARPSLTNCRSYHDNSKVAVTDAHGPSGDLGEALRNTSPDLLHRLLHAYLPERYQHGVFASDSDAIDAIKEGDPSVASAIAQIAKRQEDTSGSANATIATGPSSTADTSSAPPPASTSDTTTPSEAASSSTVAPPSTDTSAAQTSTAETSTAETVSSSEPPPTTTPESTAADTSSTSAPASTAAGSTTTAEQTTIEPPSTTSAPASTTVAPSTTPTSAPETTSASGTSTTREETTTAASSTPTTAPVSTTSSENAITSAPTTTEASETPQTTITSGSKTTSAPVLHTFTRTLPDGGTTTLTSTSWVAVLPTDQAEGAKSPDLQSAASLPRGEVMMPAIAIGLLVGAILMV